MTERAEVIDAIGRIRLFYRLRSRSWTATDSARLLLKGFRWDRLSRWMLPTTGLELAVLVLLATISMPLATGQTQKQSRVSDIPPDLLPTVQKDFGMDSPVVRKCFESTRQAFEKMVHTKWLALNRRQRPALLVEGLGPCLAGNDNGTKLIYARVSGEWRKVFDGVGDTLKVATTSTSGWRDVVLWQHDNAYRSARQLCRFDGTKYKSASCNLVSFEEEISHRTLHPPKYELCTEEFLAMRPE